MYVGTGGLIQADGEVWRSDVNDPTNWTRVANLTQCNGVFDLEVHESLLYGNELYCCCGYGVFGTAGNYRARGRIYRTFDGTTWELVYDGNPGGGAVTTQKYICFQGLKSWDDGYLYAAGSYYDENQQYRARVIRSASGDVGSWSVVFDEIATDLDTGDDIDLIGACCLESFGNYLYVGLGDRWRPRRWGEGRVYRTADGTTWTQVFGSNDDSAPQYAAAGCTCLAPHDGALWMGTGGDAKGDARVWFTLDGLTWFESFDCRGMEYQTCFCLISFLTDLYAGFGGCLKSPTEFNQYVFDQGDMWRMTSAGWDPPDAQREGAGRWPSVLSVLSELAESSLDTEGGTDFMVEPYDLGGDTQEFLFSARAPWGTDHRSTSDDPIIFGVPRGNMGDPQYLVERSQGPTVVYVLGSGGEERRPVLRFSNVAAMAASPWGRFEGTIDAQGVSGPLELWEKAMEALNQGVLESFGFVALDTPSTRYGDWDIGDLVTAVFRDIVAHCKIEGVRVDLGGNNKAVEYIVPEIRLLEIV